MTSLREKKEVKEREGEIDSRRKSDMSDDAWGGSAVVPRGFSRQKEARDDQADLLTPGNIVLVGD